MINAGVAGCLSGSGKIVLHCAPNITSGLSTSSQAISNRDSARNALHLHQQKSAEEVLLHCNVVRYARCSISLMMAVVDCGVSPGDKEIEVGSGVPELVKDVTQTESRGRRGLAVSLTRHRGQASTPSFREIWHSLRTDGKTRHLLHRGGWPLGLVRRSSWLRYVIPMFEG